MAHRFLTALGLALTLASCSSKADSTSTTTAEQQAGDFTISTRFSPDPPKQGPETITIGLKDATGSPVKGATVTIVTTMPSMSMSGPTLTAADNNDGTYSAQTNLNYATPWTFDIRAKAGAKTGHVSVKADVK
jgi:nitrogen fixation protein FixH